MIDYLFAYHEYFGEWGYDKPGWYVFDTKNNSVSSEGQINTFGGFDLKYLYSVIFCIKEL